MTDALLTIAQDPQFGADQQLIAFTTFCQCKLQEDQVALLHEVWTANSLTPAAIEGLELDTDLRWTVLTAPAAHGAVTQDDVDAALRADNTSMGVRRALTAGAALPTAENKAAVWEKLFAVEGELTGNWSIVALWMVSHGLARTRW
ncbi:MAG: ERAP1-like C-terminal domain-containing protein [Lawsonella clevelandensis]